MGVEDWVRTEVIVSGGIGIMGKRGRDRGTDAYILKLRSRVERTKSEPVHDRPRASPGRHRLPKRNGRVEIESVYLSGDKSSAHHTNHAG